MANLIWGIATILCCTGGFLAAWRWTRAGKWGLALGAITLCGLILRIYTAADTGLHDWDERYHALVGKHLALHPLRPTLYEHPLLPFSYRNWTTSYIWLHKPPVALWLIALSIKAFGLHAFVVRLPAIILTTLAIPVCYGIGRIWYGRRVGMLSAFLFSVHGFIIELVAGRAGTDAIDAIFLAMIVFAIRTSIWALYRGRAGAHFLAGMVIGVCILTKSLPALVVVLIWAAMAYPRLKDQLLKFALYAGSMLLGAAAVALPWQLYILQVFPVEAKWEMAYNTRHLFESLERNREPLLFYFDHLRIKYGELIYAPVIWFVWRAFRHGNPADRAVLVWFSVPYLFFTFSATKMEAYTIISAPAVFIITSLSFFRFGEIVGQLGGWKKYAAMAFWLGLIVLPLRYTVERIKPFNIMERAGPECNAIFQLQQSPLNNEHTVIFGCGHPVETMFFTRCTAYERPPDSIITRHLSDRGYKVIEAAGY